MDGKSIITWFEIPVIDLDRAQKFYEAVLDASLIREEMPGAGEMAVMPYQPGSVSGCLQPGPNPPSQTGTLVYLRIQNDLDAALARVKKAGGSVLLGKTELPGGMGHFAHIVDSEGNRVGLHTTPK